MRLAASCNILQHLAACQTRRDEEYHMWLQSSACVLREIECNRYSIEKMNKIVLICLNSFDTFSILLGGFSRITPWTPERVMSSRQMPRCKIRGNQASTRFPTTMWHFWHCVTLWHHIARMSMNHTGVALMKRFSKVVYNLDLARQCIAQCMIWFGFHGVNTKRSQVPLRLRPVLSPSRSVAGVSVWQLHKARSNVLRQKGSNVTISYNVDNFTECWEVINWKPRFPYTEVYFPSPRRF